MIPGISQTVGYIDLRQSSIREIADLIQQKLGRSKIRSRPAGVRVRKPPSQEADHAVPPPRIKRNFTQRERDKFIREAFSYVMQYFKKVLAKLEKSNREIETEFLKVNSVKFIGKIYFRGDTKNQCKMRPSRARRWSSRRASRSVPGTPAGVTWPRARGAPWGGPWAWRRRPHRTPAA